MPSHTSLSTQDQSSVDRGGASSGEQCFEPMGEVHHKDVGCSGTDSLQMNPELPRVA